MVYPARFDDICPPVAYADGRVFIVQDYKGYEHDARKRIYRVHLDIIEHTTQHHHKVTFFIDWSEYTNSWRRPEGKTLLQICRSHLEHEMAFWRYPEGMWNIGTQHCFELPEKDYEAI